MISEKLSELVQWIQANAEQENALLYPDPSFYVYACPLIDEVVRIFELDKNEVVGFIKKLADAREKERIE